MEKKKDLILEEIKTRMYVITKQNDIDDAIEAAKAYALLCLVESSRNSDVGYHVINHID